MIGVVRRIIAHKNTVVFLQQKASDRVNPGRWVVNLRWEADPASASAGFLTLNPRAVGIDLPLLRVPNARLRHVYRQATRQSNWTSSSRREADQAGLVTSHTMELDVSSHDSGGTRSTRPPRRVVLGRYGAFFHGGLSFKCDSARF